MPDALEDTTLLMVGACLGLMTLAATALLAPFLFWVGLVGCAAGVIALLAFLHPVPCCVVWLLVTGLSLEMTLVDLVGEPAFQPTIAVIKAIELGLAAFCALRFGMRPGLFNPIWAFVAIGVAGMAHGLYPGLRGVDSLRSLAGSVVPFAFFFCRLPPHWAGAMIRATVWCPAVAVAAGIGMAAAGVRPLFVDSGGLRLTGLGHPAFLAFVTLVGVYAALIELYRGGRNRDLTLLALNLFILLLTGARAPLIAAVSVCLLTLVFARSPALPTRSRFLMVLLAAMAMPPLLLLADAFSSVRLFNLLRADTTNLSGRDILWPVFERAAAGSPWFGWGIGAGNAIIPRDSSIALLLRTRAAHNEYLRLMVEGGYLGVALLLLMFAVWVWRYTVPLPRPERLIMRLVFVALACHAFTDNVLISTPACVLFAFTAAVFHGPTCLPRGLPKA